MNRDFILLGLEPDASKDAVKKAYRAMARKLHPDVNPAPDAHERFIEITEAYERIMRPHSQSANQTRKHTEEQMQEQAREWAKAWAKMKYEEFERKNEAFERTPMHKLLWGKGVTIVLACLAFFILIDYLLPANQSEHTIDRIKDGNPNAYSHSVNGNQIPIPSYRIIYAGKYHCRVIEQHLMMELEGQTVYIKASPLLGFVKQYSLQYSGEWSTPPDGPLDYIGLMAILLVFCLRVLMYPVKKFENKLLLLAGMIICTFSYLIALIATW